jgi:hypothetical protein
MKKSPYILLLLTAVLVSSEARAQSDDPVEIRPDFIISAGLSDGVSLISLNVEKLFFLMPDGMLAAGVGLGYNEEFNLFSSGPPTRYFILPHHVSVNFGKKRSFLELGVGASWVSGDRNNYYLVYPMAGYRYHPFNKPGFSLKAWLYYPIGQKFITEDQEVLFAPVGLSLGIAL